MHSQRIKEQRWKLFGHTLRRDDANPAETTMFEYFEEGMKFKRRKSMLIPITLNQDLMKCAKETIQYINPKKELTIRKNLK